MPTEEEMKLTDLFENHKGRVAHKFPHVMEIYDRFFKPLKESTPDLCILEIGIDKGGSLELWRKYFGAKAAIIGVDLWDGCAEFSEPSGAKILIGDQGRRDFWDAVKPQIGHPNIIIDDGSHMSADQLLTFNELWPVLAVGGLYVVEDIHTSYRREFGGGIHNPASFAEELKRFIDELHSSEHNFRNPLEMSHLFGVHVFPTLAIIEKRSPSTWGGSTMRPVEPTC